MRGNRCLLAGVIVLAAGPVTKASAAGLELHEQSTVSMGAAFAGNAAGGDLASSFWNSGALGTVHGLQSQSGYTLIAPKIEETTEAGSTLGGVGDTATLDRPVFLGASSYGYELSPNWVVGLGINAPLGLSDESDNRNWAAQYTFRSGQLKTINVNPAVAFRMPGLSIGAGLQVEHMDVTLKSNPDFAPPGSRNQVLNVDDIGFGFTAGLLVTPQEGTSIGLGFRSSVRHDLEGRITVADDLVTVDSLLGPLPARFNGFDIGAKLETPEMVTLSLRQDISPSVRFLATAEWTNWSRFGDVPITARSDGTITLLATGSDVLFVKNGDALEPIHFNWQDGWFGAIGGEFDVTPSLTLRAGAAYDRSPIQSVASRQVAIPDSDRILLAGGLSYQVTGSTMLDLAYSHQFFKDGGIDVTEPNGVRYVGSAKVSSDIIAVGLRMQLGGN